MKKRDDLEAIAELLYEWCVEHGEDYITLCVLDGVAMGSICTERPDYEDARIFRDYKNLDPSSSNREEVHGQ